MIFFLLHSTITNNYNKRRIGLKIKGFKMGEKHTQLIYFWQQFSVSFDFKKISQIAQVLLKKLNCQNLIVHWHFRD